MLDVVAAFDTEQEARDACRLASQTWCRASCQICGSSNRGRQIQLRRSASGIRITSPSSSSPTTTNPLPRALRPCALRAAPPLAVGPHRDQVGFSSSFLLGWSGWGEGRGCGRNRRPCVHRVATALARRLVSARLFAAKPLAWRGQSELPNMPLHLRSITPTTTAQTPPQRTHTCTHTIHPPPLHLLSGWLTCTRASGPWSPGCGPFA